MSETLIATQEKTLPVEPKSVVWNPSLEQLREFASEMPNARRTEFDNLNVATRVVSRSKGSTFVATDTPEQHSDQTIPRAEYARMAKLQDDFIRTRDMLVIEGYIGNDPSYRVATRLIIEKANANIAAMQDILYYPATADEIASFEPQLTVIYTPNLKAEGYPDERLIAVDLENYITRVFNSDYFGESKKGGLRMWNKLVYERGGLALHAGCKVIPVGDKQRVGLIVGLSGTGKTTTTFTKQNDSQPVQDDFCALMPGGKIYATENGCFAKTFGLNPNDEPTIYHACASRHAYLENVSQNDEGKVDYFDTSYTPNGRAVIRMEDIAGAADAQEITAADFLLILNRNENIIPAVAKLEGPLAAAYFMLGETKGTSAGGAAEAGKSLRVPGTNPFFPLLHAYQGNRMRADEGQPDGGLPHEHRLHRRRRQGRGLEEGEDPALVRGRESDRRGNDQVGERSGLWLPRGHRSPGHRRRRLPAAEEDVRAAGETRRVQPARRQVQQRPARVLAEVEGAGRGDCGRDLTLGSCSAVQLHSCSGLRRVAGPFCFWWFC
jgi:phosphoenolpyruvate carboxykinase (ATP)